jgi:hypothetical protein
LNLKLVQSHNKLKQGTAPGGSLEVRTISCFIVSVQTYFTTVHQSLLGCLDDGVRQLSQLPVIRSLLLNGLAPCAKLIPYPFLKLNTPTKTSVRGVPKIVQGADFTMGPDPAQRGTFRLRQNTLDIYTIFQLGHGLDPYWGGGWSSPSSLSKVPISSSDSLLAYSSDCAMRQPSASISGRHASIVRCRPFRNGVSDG